MLSDVGIVNLELVVYVVYITFWGSPCFPQNVDASFEFTDALWDNLGTTVLSGGGRRIDSEWPLRLVLSW